jgi:hypothetical protein
VTEHVRQLQKLEEQMLVLLLLLWGCAVPVQGGAFAAAPVMSSGVAGPTTWSATLSVEGATLANDMVPSPFPAHATLGRGFICFLGSRTLHLLTGVGCGAGEWLEHACVLLPGHMWPRGANHRALPRRFIQLDAG